MFIRNLFIFEGCTRVLKEVLKLGWLKEKTFPLLGKLILQNSKIPIFVPDLCEKVDEICKHLFGVLLHWNACDCCPLDRAET